MNHATSSPDLAGDFGGFAAATLALEETLRRRLALAPVPIPNHLTRIDVHYRGAAGHMSARAYCGGPIAYARVVSVRAPGLTIGNLLAVPQARWPLPVLGVDLVALGSADADQPARAIFVADLSPLDADRNAAERVARAVAERAPPSASSPLPSWAERLFSDHALCVNDAEPARRQLALQGCTARVEAFCDVVAQTSDRAGAAIDPAARADAYERYAALHRTEDRGLRMLAGLCTPDLAADFIARVMFPAGACRQ